MGALGHQVVLLSRQQLEFMKLIPELSYTFYVGFSLDLSISTALPTAKFLPTPVLSTAEILIVKPTLEVSGRSLKCFPQIRCPHLHQQLWS